MEQKKSILLSFKLIFSILFFILFLIVIYLFYDINKFKKVHKNDSSSAKKYVSAREREEDISSKNHLQSLLTNLSTKLSSLESLKSTQLTNANENMIRHIDETKNTLSEQINQLQQIIKDNKEDKKTDQVFQRAIEKFQQQMEESISEEDRTNCTEFITLMRKFQHNTSVRNRFKEQLETNQASQNAVSDPSKKNLFIERTGHNEIESDLKKARTYLNSYANLISIFLEDLEEIERLKNIEDISSLEKLSLSNIEKCLKTDMVKNLLKLITINRSDDISRIFASMR
ncbi:MAG: hypothetical protein Q8888_01160 [Vigna little leaf phytoplasma]|nr:hypothetical protein [Vigna little leaf phytoplasma]